MAGGMEIQWYRLDNFQCPAIGCESTERFDWVCNVDSSSIFIAQIGELRCSNARSPHNGKICTWGFDCGSHGVAGYKKANSQRASFALSQAVQLMDKAGSAWVGQLITSIGEQFGV